MATEFRLPELGENVSAGAVTKILVNVGDTISAGQNIIEIETDKAVAEIPCPLAGKVIEMRVREGEKINAGDIILLIDEDAAAVAKTPEKTKEPEPKAPTAAASDAAVAGETARRAVRAAPSVRQLAREHDVSLEEVPTDEPSGKTTARDVRDYVATREKNASGNTSPATPDGLERDHDKWGQVVFEPMNSIRSKAAIHLTHCWTTIPHVTHFDKADITELEKFRKRHARQAEDAGVHLTVTAFLIKLLPEIFKRFPRMNASVDMEQQRFILKQYCHIGVAVDTPNGLIVPVIRHVDTRSIIEIAKEMADMAVKARERNLTLDEMQGSGFTVSNLGGMGGYAFTPIINAPETAILGISRATIEPVYNGREFEARLMLPMSLSYDHRCIDGADAARFLRYLCESLEQPWRLTLGL